MSRPSWFCLAERFSRLRQGRFRHPTRLPRTRLLLESMESRCLPSTFLVTNTDDAGAGSLRQAILDTDNSSGANTIAFALSGSGLHTIVLQSPLPAITNPVTLDGTTQPGFVGTPIIELDGSGAGGNAVGLQISAGNSTVRGLVIHGFSQSGIAITGSNASGNVIEENYIGTDATGTTALANVVGVDINGAPNNTIGGTTPEARNLISGNSQDGIRIAGMQVHNTLIQGNYIGTDLAGQSALGNRYGIEVVTGTTYGNTIGGTLSGAGNLISGNTVGINVEAYLVDAATIQGNLIGTTADGMAPLANSTGILVGGQATATIGGTAAGARNIISGNVMGVAVEQDYAATTIQGNFIGTDLTGTAAVQNGTGIYVDDAAGVSINANLISGNGTGAFISGFIDYPTVVTLNSNLIGTDVSGTQALPNRIGLDLHYAYATVGGTTSAMANVIAGNTDYGIQISNDRMTGRGNLIENNYIGTDVSGTTAMGNGVGINIINCPYQVIVGNLIAASNGAGIQITRGGHDLIQGNEIGTDLNGDNALANAGPGILIDSAVANTLGGTAASAGNLISGNGADGIRIQGSAATGNLIQGNAIGTASGGISPLGNANSGVHILGGAHDNLIGGTAAGAGNTIAFNDDDGVWVDAGNGNAILCNSIFSSGNLGIELTNGGNNGQAFPVLTAAASNGSTTTIQGNLHNAPMTTYWIEFFANASCNPSGFGEGEQFLAAMTVTTDDAGTADFTLMIDWPVSPGQFITATATDPGNNTSSFSACVAVAGAAGPASGRLMSPLVQPADMLVGEAACVQHRQMGRENLVDWVARDPMHGRDFDQGTPGFAPFALGQADRDDEVLLYGDWADNGSASAISTRRRR